MSDNKTYRWNFELQRRFLQRDLCHLYGFDYAELIWARETLTRLERTREEIEYSYQDRADLKKARDTLDKAKVVAEFYDPNQRRDARGRWTSGGTLDVQKAVAKLETAGRRSQGRCAAAVREAIKEGGIELEGRPKSGRAKYYGPTLLNNGFNAEAEADARQGFPPNKDYRPQAGDVVVIQPPNSKDGIGHMVMFNGKRWISDYWQSIRSDDPTSFWPGNNFRTSRPSYVIYRHKKT